MRHILFYLVGSLAFTACTSTPYYNRYFITADTDRTYQDLLDERYSCAKESTSFSSSSSTSVNANTGLGNASSDAGVSPNCSIFTACLAARGWISDDFIVIGDPNRPYGFQVPDSLGMQCVN